MSEIKSINNILVTGGAGYIGSHCALNLLENGYNVIIFDNLVTGHIETVNELKKYGQLTFIQGDLTNCNDIKSVFQNHNISAVVHFAAFSQVGESVTNPEKYYQNNVAGTLNLLSAMLESNVKYLVFSSTAATYGEPQYVPIDELHPQKPINPYGKTKLMIENILDDYDVAYGLKSVRLRYFNVIGADNKCRVGEWHIPETHLVPNILKSALSTGRTFELYGTDYNTPDGTCVRDYINIEDLVTAHILALKYLDNGGETNFFNLGTKDGSTVKEIFETCRKITESEIPVEYKDRRQGDPAILVADNSKAETILNWHTKHSLKDSIQTAFIWEKKVKGMLNV